MSRSVQVVVFVSRKLIEKILKSNGNMFLLTPFLLPPRPLKKKNQIFTM